MLRSVYQPLIDSFFILSWPWLKNKYTEGYGERRGFQSDVLIEKLAGERPFWAHGVSVGEVQALIPIIRAARGSGYSGPIMISTTTETGKKMAYRLGKDLFDHHIYYPWDKREFVKRAVKSLHPWAFATAETELWPNMLWELKDASIPAFLVNGRISDRTWERLNGPLRKKIGASVYNLFTEIFLRETRDYDRLTSMGVSPQKLNVFGDTKTDALLLRKDNGSCESWRRKFDADRYKIFTAGSTHIGEDEVVIKAFETVRERDLNTKLIVAPRHPERAQEVLEIARRKFSAALLTSENYSSDVTVVDRIGVLFDLYGISISAFVGGSFVDKGGQNILEPVSWGIPVQYGPHMEDFAEASQKFIGLGIATQVSDGASLGDVWLGIIEKSGHNGDGFMRLSQEYFQSCSGSSVKTWERICRYHDLEGPVSVMSPSSF